MGKIKGMKKIKFKLFFAWYDGWIGFFYDRKKKILYICFPFPMIVLSIQRRTEPIHFSERFEKFIDEKY